MSRKSARAVRPAARARLRGPLRAAALALCCVLPLALTGCIGVGLTLLGAAVGVGSGTAVGYSLNGVAYRTFAASLPSVERATVVALGDMGLRLQQKQATPDGKTLKASGKDRDIEIQLEPVSARTTRIRTVVRMGPFFKDRATATEIIIQTERVLART
jgi:hypothetical protein